MHNWPLQYAPPHPPLPPLFFYQSYWHMVGHDVTQAISSCLNLRALPSPMNHTFITLVPKVKEP